MAEVVEMDEPGMISTELKNALLGIEMALRKGDVEKAKYFLNWAEEKADELEVFEAKCIAKMMKY